jgi:hypothetical protein
MNQSLTQAQINDIVARAAETIRRSAREPSLVYELPGTPQQVTGGERPDGWCGVGTVVDVPGSLSYVVWWHPVMRRSLFGHGRMDD